MPTRKQRRRREKERRHEWEEVYVDETGREVDPEEAESLARSRASTNGRAPAAARRPPQPRRAQRVIEPPSWRRVGKRSLIFAPFMFLVLTFLDNETTVLARALYTLQLMLLFVPFSYVVDSVAYRMYRKRVAGEAAEKTPS